MRPERIFLPESDHKRKAIQLRSKNVVDLRLGPFVQSSENLVVSVVQSDTFYRCLLLMGSLLTNLPVG